jgi:sec-independent protein translocase protein TatA
MFGISGEHLLVLLVILLVFGPKRLPDLGASLGRTLKNFKDAMNTNHAPAAQEQNNSFPAGASAKPLPPTQEANATVVTPERAPEHVQQETRV